MMDATDDLSTVEAAWRAFTADPESEPPGTARAVRIIDLLDDEVDLSPARHRPHPPEEDPALGFGAVEHRFRAAVAALPEALPGIAPLAEARDLPSTTVGELVRAGLVTIQQGPPRMPSGTGDRPC